MPFPRDRAPTILEQTGPAWPHPPLNVSVSSGLEKETIDIRWTNPGTIVSNTCFNILGVNIYRSFDSEFGPFERLNSIPVGADQWRDNTQTILAFQEDVSKSFETRGYEADPRGRYLFRTKHSPIVISPTLGSADCTNLNVQVTVNGNSAFVERIYPDKGIVELRTTPTFDVISQTQTPVVLPTDDDDSILATYRYLNNQVKTRLAQRVFYRVTTVATTSDGKLLETPIERSTYGNRDEVEKLDYIWTEAIRRNLWIQFQGGERVKLFIRKSAGPECGCGSSIHKQPSSHCKVCYNTGIIGGYEGPFDMIMAPDDSARNIKQTNRGRTVEHTYDTWTGPRPLLSQRDFIVKQNGDRYGIGPVRMPSNRGMQLQQMFTITRLDESHVVYRVPTSDPLLLESPQTRYLRVDHRWGQSKSIPMMTEKRNIGDERELRGNSVTWDNINH